MKSKVTSIAVAFVHGIRYIICVLLYGNYQISESESRCETFPLVYIKHEYLNLQVF
jgi:hypothetical protein